MRILEKVKLVLSATENERERVNEQIRRYLEKINKRKSPYLIVSSYIEDEIAEKEEPTEDLTVQEKTNAIAFLNKRLSQINNTEEKVAMICNYTYAYVRENVHPSKINSFTKILIKRVLEQIKVQVSANPPSSLGYSLFLIFLSKQFPNIIKAYKRTIFTSVLSLDYVLGMYRVYFVILKETKNLEEAWAFGVELANYVENTENTFNPCVLHVFLEVLNETMRRAYKNAWHSVEKCILTQYLPVLSSSFSKDTYCIRKILTS